MAYPSATIVRADTIVYSGPDHSLSSEADASKHATCSVCSTNPLALSEVPVSRQWSRSC